MLEIKCPYTREIKGIPPIYYWYQMQQQLKVCKLNECDFLECNIKEYNSWYEFENDNYNGDYTKNSMNLEKGVIIEYLNVNEEDPWNIYGYIYPPKLDMTINEIYDWHKKIQIDLEKDTYIYKVLDEVKKNQIRVILRKIENNQFYFDDIKQGIVQQELRPVKCQNLKGKSEVQKTTDNKRIEDYELEFYKINNICSTQVN